jgi:nitrate/TMAO reductase-like tetraheme cytochrome c subunit
LAARPGEGRGRVEDTVASSPLVQFSLVGVTIALALLLAFRVELTRALRGKILAFIALFVLPMVALTQGFDDHMEQAKKTEFCLSCHVMEPYGRTLYIDDPSFVPAAHFQNHLVPTEQTCFTCHTTYTMFGDYSAKLRGLRHLYVQYLGTIPKPEDIKLYTPYNNRECLHCHDGMRKYLEATPHKRTPAMLQQMAANTLSCTKSDCHEFIHNVADLKDSTFWKPAR